MAGFAPIRSARRPKTKANGTPTSWTTTSVVIMLASGIPISPPKMTPIAMIVLTASL